MNTSWSDSYLKSIEYIEKRILELNENIKKFKFQSGNWHKIHRRIITLEYEHNCLWESYRHVKDYEDNESVDNLNYYTIKEEVI